MHIMYLAGDIYQNLIKEILNELLLKRSRGEEAVQVSTKKLGNKVAITALDIPSTLVIVVIVVSAYISSRGEIKMSLREMTCADD